MLDAMATVASYAAGGVLVLCGWLCVWIVLVQALALGEWICGVRFEQRVHWVERVVFGNLTRIC